MISTDKPLAAASILLLREAAAGLEVFMVERHAKTAFASALVFPGGKVAPGDDDPAVRALCDGAAEEGAAFALGVAAIREAFEESGILLARGRDGAFVSAEVAAALAGEREGLASGASGLAGFLDAANLRLACDALVPFAHWITPSGMARRFDTHFFLAAAPDGQAGLHDGGETVASEWLTPQAALDRAEGGGAKLMFPTRMNLMRLAESGSIAEALRAALARPVVAIEPKVIQRDGLRYVTIPRDAGYAVTEALLDGIEA